MKKYDSYKESGIDWIGEIPSHWEIKRFKSLFIEHSGNGFPHEFQGNETGDIPFYKVSSLNGDGQFVEHSNNYVSMDNVLKMKWNIVPANTILTAKIGESLRKNHRKISKTPSIIDNNCLGIESKMIDKKLAFYMLKIIDFDLFTNPGAVPSVSMEKLRYHIFPITNEKEEQSAIANYLDQKTTQIDDLIFKKEQFIQLLEEERVAVINQAVTKGLDPTVTMKDSGIEWLGEIPEHWSYSSLKWYSKIYSGGTPSKDVEDYWLNGTIPWLNSGCVNQWDITEVSDYITEEAFKNSSAKWIPNKSLVIALAGQGKTKGMVAQVQFETTCNQSLGVIVPNEKIYNRFLQYWLKNNYQNIRSLGGGDKRDGLNLVMIGGIPIPVLPLNEQEKISNYLDSINLEIDSIKAKTEQEIELLKEYKTALISEVVTGKVDVRNEILN